MKFKIFLCALLSLLFCLELVAESDSVNKVDQATKDNPELTLAYRGDVVLSQQAIDAAFSRILPKDRLPFIRDGAKVERLVNNIMQTGALAQDALKAGYDKEPMIAERMRMGAEEELAKAWLEEVVRRAPEPDYDVLALEDYKANPQNYRTELFVNVKHLLISTQERTVEEAEKIAEGLLQQITQDSSVFDDLVVEHSEDPAVEQNSGVYNMVTAGKMVKPFEDAAFALQEPGQFSDLVRTDYGFHVIRLESRGEPAQLPWEKVKETARLNVRQKFLQDYQLKYVQALIAEPIHIPAGAVEVMAKRHFGENLEKAPFKTP